MTFNVVGVSVLPMTTTRVKVEVTLDINTEAWGEAYGCDAEEVPADVTEWAWDALDQQLMSLGLGRKKS